MATCENIIYETYLAPDKPSDFFCTEGVSECNRDAVCRGDLKSCDAGEQYCDELDGIFTRIG